MSTKTKTLSPAALFAAFLAGVVALAVVLGLAALAKNDDDGVSWLYSQSANEGVLEDLGSNRYRLTMKNVDLHTIMFSDRPDRLVEVIDTKDLVDSWGEVFATSAPNAVLVEHEPDGTTDSLVLVLEQPVLDVKAKTIVYEAELLADEMHPERLKKLVDAHLEPPSEFYAVSLFIDSVATPSDSGTPVFTGSGANALVQKLGLGGIPTKPVSLGSGVSIVSADVAVAADGSVNANATIALGSHGLKINATLAVKDANNWKITAASSGAAVWTPDAIPGFTLDPNTLSGTITNTAGKINFAFTGASHTWNIEDGATYSSTLTLTSTCPFSDAAKCPSNIAGPYLGMTGSLTINGFSNSLALQGGLALEGKWARLEGNAGDLTFNGTGVKNATVTVWRGTRTDSYDPNMELPDLGILANGTNMEFCGQFTIDIPKVTNTSKNGCVRWSPSGFVIGQVTVGADLSGTLPSTGTSGASSVNLKGLAWTNISTANLNLLPKGQAVFAGVPVALQDKKFVLSGKAQLPGAAASAMNIDLKGATSLVFNVTGEFSTSSVSLTGEVPTSIKIGSEPFKIDINKMTATIAAGKDSGVSFAMGSSGQATLGYGTNSRVIQTSTQLVAATSPAVGMSLSVTARGTAASGDTKDGLTAQTALSKPSQAQYVWPDQFGIKGLNLWNLTVQIAFQSGSPALGYTSTTYMDPKGAQTKNVIACASSPCTESDWLVGTLGFNISYTNPCFAYQFASKSGGAGFAVDGGALKATTFKVGVAPTGCSIQSGDTQLVLPKAFVGFQFDVTFGDAPATNISVATKVSADGFYYSQSISNLTVAGMQYSTVLFQISISSSESRVYFTADMTSAMGSMSVTSDFVGNSSGMAQTLDASLTNWNWSKKGTVTLDSFLFKTTSNIPTQGGCASFSTAASGKMTLGSTQYTLQNAAFAFNCKAITNLELAVTYSHTAKWSGAKTDAYFDLKYPTTIGNTSYLYGDAGFKYERTFSKKYKDRTFRRGVDVMFDMSLTVNPGNPADAGFSFSGKFDADRVSGAIGCSMDPGGADFTCGGELRLNPSWAGVYRFDWGDL